MTAPEIEIRDESAADFAAVFEIHADAFGREAEARLVDELRGAAGPALSLVAVRSGRPVGHVFVSRVRIEGQPTARPCAGLAPLGVVSDQQRTGVGSALMREAIARCPGLGFGAVFLLGDPGYYHRFDFALAAPRGFHYERVEFDPAFQVLEVEAGALAGGAGWVRYPEAFARL